MATELGHMSAEIGLDISPFLTNQAVLRTQIRRTGQLLQSMQNASKLGIGNRGDIFNRQVSQLKMYGQQVKNFRDQYVKAQQDLARRNTVDNQRGLASSYTQLQNAALKYDTLRISAARTYQQMRAANSFWGQQAAKIGDYGDQLEKAGAKIRSFGSGFASAAIGGMFYNATKSAINFKSQIQAIGPLLSDNGRITATISRQLNEMSNASMKWAQQYGISTSSINNAMTELVRRGFTANQTIGSMPAILNASRASGESLGVVMQATASAIEMFGLKANTAAQQTKNTQRVTDVLTVAANKTASSFADISAAMTYVGPTAAQAHMSIEQVAAAIGALSNRGIEASTAGTTLRQVLSKLTTDTKVNRAHMQAIGVDIDEIKRKGVDLPKLIDQINNKLKDKTPTEKMALLNAAFGKLGQGVMALFTKSNSASKSAGSELRALEVELEHAGGTTARIAKQMNNTPKAKWDRFVQTLHTVGITIGSELLPAFQQAMKFAKGLADKFDSLSPATKKAVTNMLLFIAAIKPLSALVAAPITGLGKIMNAIKAVDNVGAKIAGGSLANALRAVDSAAGRTGGLSHYSNALRIINTHSQNTAKSTTSLGNNIASSASKFISTGASASSLAGNVSKIGTSAATSASGMATFSSALAATGEAAVAVTTVVAAAVAGFEIYKLAIKPATSALLENLHETQVWGSHVGQAASQAGEKYKDFSDKATAAIKNAASGTKESADSIKNAFKGMADSAEQSVNKQNNVLKKLSKDLGGAAGATIERARKRQLRNSQDQVKAIQQDARMAEKIVENSSKNGLHLTADTRTELNNLQADMASHFVKTLNVSRSTANRMESIINGTFNKRISARTGRGLINSFGEALTKNVNATRTKMNELKSIYDQGRISYRDYMTSKAQLETTYGGRSVKYIESMARVLRAEGKSWKDVKGIVATVASQYGATGAQIDQALYNVEHAHHRTTQSIVADTTKVSGQAKKAAVAWNGLVLNPKTGKVKANVGKFLTDIAKTDSGWKQLKFITKHAKISNNAKDLITDAAVASGRWQSMTFDEKEALVHSNIAEDMMVYLEGNHQWNSMNFKVQQAIVKAKGKKDLLDIFTNLKTWNGLNPEQKDLIINYFNGTDKLKLELQDIKEWNALPVKKKKAILEAAKTGGLENALKQAHVWMALPETMRKQIEALDKTGQGIASAKRAVNGFTKSKSRKTVDLKLNTGNVTKDIANMSRSLNNMQRGKHTIFVTAKPDGKFKETINFAKTLNGMNNKRVTAHVSATGTQQVKEAANAQGKLAKTGNVRRNNSLHTTGAGETQAGTAAQHGIMNTKSASRHNKLKTTGTGETNAGTAAQRGIMNTHRVNHHNSLHTTGTGETNAGAAAQRNLMGTRAVHIVNTITTYIQKIGSRVSKAFGHHYWGTAGAWDFKHFEYGTPNTGFKGGKAIVGDGGRKEVVYQPKSQTLFTTPATDTLMDLEKGSIIWRSVEAFEQAMHFAGIKDYPKFGDGSASASLVNLANQLPDNVEEQVKALADKQSQSAIKASKETRDLQMQNNELIAMLVQQNQQMMMFLSRVGFKFVVNDKEFARATAQENSKAISNYIKQSGMRFT